MSKTKCLKKLQKISKQLQDLRATDSLSDGEMRCVIAALHYVDIALHEPEPAVQPIRWPDAATANSISGPGVWEWDESKYDWIQTT